MIEQIAMFPVLVVKNIQAQKEFYENHFGFQTQFFDAEFYLHMLNPESGAQLGFMMQNHPSQPEFLHDLASSTGMVISFDVPEARSAYEVAVNAGWEFVLDYTVEEFGLTHFMIKDPAGLVVDIVEHHTSGPD